MANTDSTSTAMCDKYQHFGNVTPTSTLSTDPQLLKVAAKLHQQAKEMDQAQRDGLHFAYRPIRIPQRLHNIFGS